MAAADDVSIADWQEPENLRWSFQHMDALFPTATIPRGETEPAVLQQRPVALGGIAVVDPAGTTRTADEILDAAHTDAWAVWHDGALVAEEYRHGMTATKRHLLMSVSKSVVSLTVASLVQDGTLRLDDVVGDVAQALAGGGYADATVRQLLDMRTGVRFSEDYADARAEVRLLDQSVGWAPLEPGNPGELVSFLAGMVKEREHGGAFVYRSADTDALGVVVESVTGRRYAEIAGERLWSRLGAESDAYVTVDPAGTAMFDGGTCATLRDLVRFGLLVLDEGLAPSGQRVVDAAWIRDLFDGGADSDAAFAAGPHAEAMPGGKYRGQFWFPTSSRDVVCALGIHGQLVYVDRARRLVAAIFASHPVPVDPESDMAVLGAVAAIGDHLAG
ncbi:serine hydrolase domain-containing protein [Zhihengliuella halotolerans]|uniref:serine hydrolase domain-containing protein n=1 Tax=Zhihengliuella halotolerans TaxID=370736 RepID=UPI000C80765D|nr:serine hydrolase [Zhihengliuella halotolerans]